MLLTLNPNSIEYMNIEDTDLKLVVIGYKAKGYDYVAVDYPIGYETSDSLRYFNHDQIKDLYSFHYNFFHLFLHNL